MDNLETFSKQYLLDTYARDYTHFVRGDGARLYTNEGAEYIDFTAGIGVNALGHNHPKLIESIANQARKMIHISNLFYIDSQVELAKKIVELASESLESSDSRKCDSSDSNADSRHLRVFFCNSGLEANECAIKIARKYGESRKRYKIITLQNSFHGRSIATLKACGQDKMHTHFGPFPDGFIRANDIKDAISIAKRDKEVVAIFLELIQGEGGIYAMPRDLVRELADFCESSDILLMIDEVQSGIFRSGAFLTAQIYGIKPNVITLAKGLAGGVPIGAVITDKVDIFAPSEHGSTFGGNPLSTSAGITALEVLSAYQKNGELARHIKIFEAHLESLQNAFPGVILGVSGLGFMRGLKIKNDETLGAIIQKARENRVLVLKSGNATLRFLPPLLITKDELDEGFARLKGALEAL